MKMTDFDQKDDKTSDPLEELKDLMDDDLFTIHTRATTSHTHDIYLSEQVEDNYSYTRLLHFLRTLPAGNKINMYLASYGGSCSTGGQIIHAIRDCASPVHMIVDAPCYRMGAILALAGASLELKPNTFLMFHNYSAGRSGKGGEMVLGTIETNHWVLNMFATICYPFLTQEEIHLLKLDQDVYVHSEDKGLKARMKRHYPTVKNKKR